MIGEGLQELSDVTLTGENREEIATTLGVPHSMVFSNAANFATSQTDKMNLHDLTIIPEAKRIARLLNKQLFNPLGYQFEFLPETLDIYQEDEHQRAQSYSQYVGAGMKPSIAAEILGIELPHGIEYIDLDEEDEPEPSPAQPFGQPSPQPPQPDAEQVAEKRAVYLDKWRRMVLNRHDKGKTLLHEFDAEGWLSPLEIAHVRGHLVTATSKAEIETAFRAETAMTEQEGGADQDFFTLPQCWIGENTPSPEESIAAWKALLLQLDPDDDEAEQKIRMGLERKTERDLAKALGKEQEIVLGRVQRYEEAIDFFREDLENTLKAVRDEREMYDMLQRALLQGVDLGVSVVINEMETGLGGFGFDYTLAHSDARAWVSQYTFELVSGIDSTTERLLRQALVTWVNNGLSLSDLEEQLVPIFGRGRSSLVASTEVTRAYQMGSEAAWKASKIISEISWATVLDELVCSVCGPRNGMKTSLENPNFDGIARPPAHPRCRCFTRAIVS